MATASPEGKTILVSKRMSQSKEAISRALGIFNERFGAFCEISDSDIDLDTVTVELVCRASRSAILRILDSSDVLLAGDTDTRKEAETFRENLATVCKVVVDMTNHDTFVEHALYSMLERVKMLDKLLENDPDGVSTILENWDPPKTLEAG